MQEHGASRLLSAGLPATPKGPPKPSAVFLSVTVTGDVMNGPTAVSNESQVEVFGQRVEWKVASRTLRVVVLASQLAASGMKGATADKRRGGGGSNDSS